MYKKLLLSFAVFISTLGATAFSDLVVQPVQAASQLSWPTDGVLGTLFYEPTRYVDCMAGVYRHCGIDIWTNTEGSGNNGTRKGNKVYAAANGTIESIQSYGGVKYGVTITHPSLNIKTQYLHLANGSTSFVTPGLYVGQAVNASTVLGHQGDLTGPGDKIVHLHFVIQQIGSGVAMDPTPYFDGTQLYFGKPGAPARKTHWVKHFDPCTNSVLPGCGSAKAITGVTFANNPAIAAFNDKLFVAMKSADSTNKLYMTNRNSNGKWLSPAKGYDNIKFSGSPALTTFNGKLYMAFRSADGTNSLYIATSTDGVTWPTAKKVAGKVFRDDPAIVAFKGRLYVAFRANDDSNTLYITSSADGVTWTNAIHYPGFKFQGSPALAVYNKRMYVAFRANDSSNSLYFASSSDGTNWPASATKATGISLSESPTMVAAGGKLHIAFKANDASNTLYTASTTTGTSWSAATQYSNIKLQGSPRMGSMISGGVEFLYMAFRANDTSNTLYFTISPNNGLSWVGQ